MEPYVEITEENRGAFREMSHLRLSVGDVVIPVEAYREKIERDGLDSMRFVPLDGYMPYALDGVEKGSCIRRYAPDIDHKAFIRYVGYTDDAEDFIEDIGEYIIWLHYSQLGKPEAQQAIWCQQEERSFDCLDIIRQTKPGVILKTEMNFLACLEEQLEMLPGPDAALEEPSLEIRLDNEDDVGEGYFTLRGVVTEVHIAEAERKTDYGELYLFLEGVGTVCVELDEETEMEVHVGDFICIDGYFNEIESGAPCNTRYCNPFGTEFASYPPSDDPAVAWQALDTLRRQALGEGVYTRYSIIRRYNAGEPLEFLYFWSHTGDTAEIGPACFSQWYPCTFTVDGVVYHTAEQFMMAQKAKLFGDGATYQKILAAESPKDCKALGRAVQGFDETLWQEKRLEIAMQGNFAKFSQNPELKAYLLSTGEQIPVAASVDDAIWGVQLAIDAPEIQDPNAWQGENLMGSVIMKTRSLLRGNAF